MRFESLGGAGHGWEFGLFQRHYGAEPLGLLRWADLGSELLMQALEAHFDGVGQPENTIIFTPEGSKEWWTKDTRYWMVMQSSAKAAEVSPEQMHRQIHRRTTFLRRKLIEDLQQGKKIFVFKDIFRNLDEMEIERLRSAIRSYGPATLFYIRYADAGHPPGTVQQAAPGLLIGYIRNFTFSPEDKYLGPAHAALLALCRNAWAIHTGTPIRQPVRQKPRPPARRPRRIVLFGNCQMQAMTQLYQRFVAGRTGDVLEHIASYKDLTEAGRSAIEQADIVVEQLLDLKPQADTDGVSTTTPRLFIPMVTAAFLWPFAGQPHPKNTQYPFLTGGPYGGEASDSYLNRLILAGTEPHEAVEAYSNLDVRKRINLDRLFELIMDRQKSRDEATGYRIADLIETHFRSEQIFLSPYHPNVRIAVALATQFFQQLGADPDDIERMQSRTRITPFPKGELPLHPAVCRHFSLDFIGPDRTYRFMNEGLFSFREYALRYMRYEWNDALEEGMSLTHAKNYTAAHEQLTAGLRRSPQSAAGYNALGHVLQHTGARIEAITAAQRAVEIEPENAAYRANLGNMLREQGQVAAAEAALRTAIETDPTDPHYRVLLAHVLRQLGHAGEAAHVMRDAIRLDPWSVNLRLDLAGILESQADWAGTVEALQSALVLDPDHGSLRLRLSQMLNRLDRPDDALAVAQNAVELDPASAACRINLSELLLRQDRRQEALTQAYIAAVSDPDDARAYAHLGHTLRQTGDLAAAEQAMHRAILLQPDNAHLRHEMSSLLSHMQRFTDAVQAAREAAERDPHNAGRLAHVAHVLALAKDFPQAQAVQRLAAEMAPETISYRLVLSDLFAREGRLPEALHEARLAVDQWPDHAQALGHLAHIRQMMGELDEAEETLRLAIQLAPHNDHLRREHARLRDRRDTQSARPTMTIM